MKIDVLLTDSPLDPGGATDVVRTNDAGAVLMFLGTVREITNGVGTELLEYEAYPEMAERQMRNLAEKAAERWSLKSVAVHHRIGRTDPGEISVVIAVSSPHRAEAFAAGRWLIDTLKEEVPIWKKEVYSDGREEWQHPAGQNTPQTAADPRGEHR